MVQKAQVKTLLIGSAVALIVIALSVGATLFVLSEQQGEGGTEASTQDENANLPLNYYSFGQAFITTVEADYRPRHLQVFVALAYRDASLENVLKTHAPLLRSRLLQVFGNGNFLALQSADGRETLQGEALETVNQTLAEEGAGSVERVLFTNFVLQ